MRIAKAVLSIISAVLSATDLTLIAVALAISGTPFTLPYLALHLAAFLLSISLIVKISARVTGDRRRVYITLISVGIFLVAPIALLPTLVINIVTAVLLLMRRYTSESERYEFSREDRHKIYVKSSTAAIRKILDPDNREDIALDNGERIVVFRQVALINLGQRQYALLSPIDASRDEPGAALAYAIEPDSESGKRVLVPVKDEALYRRIFAVYEDLLRER